MSSTNNIRKEHDGLFRSQSSSSAKPQHNMKNTHAAAPAAAPIASTQPWVPKCFQSQKETNQFNSRPLTSFSKSSSQPWVSKQIPLRKESLQTFSRPPIVDKCDMILYDRVCTCINRKCRGECITFLHGSPNDSRHVVNVIVIGQTDICEKYTNSYNARSDSCTNFCRNVRSNTTIDKPCDYAFRLLSFDFNSFFNGLSEEFIEHSFTSQKCYFRLINLVLKNVVSKFCKTQYCGMREYKSICDEFDKINRDNRGNRERNCQMNPFFSLSLEIAGDQLIKPCTSNIDYIATDSKESNESVRVFKLPESVKETDIQVFDTGYMQYLYKLLAADKTRSVVLQVTIPDGRWVLKSGKKRHYACRWSDIHISFTARGKAHKNEPWITAACRETNEELRANISQHSLRETGALWGSEKLCKLFSIDVNDILD
jgi:hypothetical protein